MNNPQFRSIIITGASSGIGAGLALSYAAQSVTLCLIGRNRDRLAAIAAGCRDQGAVVIDSTLDVTDESAMRNFLQEQDAIHKFDLVIANAGISGGTRGLKMGTKMGTKMGANTAHETETDWKIPRKFMILPILIFMAC